MTTTMSFADAAIDVLCPVPAREQDNPPADLVDGLRRLVEEQLHDSEVRQARPG